MYFQSKVTEIVKDSSDDLWFLEEDAAAASSDHHSVDVYADEYEVVSEAYSETDSDMDNILSSQEVRKATFLNVKSYCCCRKISIKRLDENGVILLEICHHLCMASLDLSYLHIAKP